MSQRQDEQIESQQSSISMKHRLHRVLERSDGGFSWFDIFIISLICLNVVALIVETVDDIHDVSPLAFRAFDTISVAIFTVEYVLRLWSCTAEERVRASGMGKTAIRPDPRLVHRPAGHPAVLPGAPGPRGPARLASPAIPAGGSPPGADRAAEPLLLRD